MGILARQARLLELRPVGWAFVSLLPLSSGEKVAARPDEGFCPRKNGNSHSLCFFFEYSVEHIAILGFVGCAV